jgi:hypothetical protein
MGGAVPLLPYTPSERGHIQLHHFAFSTFLWVLSVTENSNEWVRETNIGEYERKRIRNDEVNNRRTQQDMGKPREIRSTTFAVKCVIGYFPNLFVFFEAKW